MNRKGRRKYIKNRLNDRQEKKEPRIKCFHSITQFTQFESLPCSKSYKGNIDGFDFMVYYMVHVTPGCDSRGTEKLFF